MILENSCNGTSSINFEKVVVLVLDDEDSGSQDLMLEEDININDDELVQRKTLQELRNDDPFHFFSIPGSLRHEFVESKESSMVLLSSLQKGKINRKTRVSTEVHGDLCMIEIMKEIEEESKKTAKKQKNKKVIARAA